MVPAPKKFLALVWSPTDALGGWKGRGSQPTLYNLASKGLVGTPLIRRVQNQISRRRSSFAPPCQELPKGGRTASQAVEPSQTDVSIVGHRAGGVEPHPSVNSFGLRADGRFRGVERPKKPAHALQPGPRKAARYTPNQTRPSFFRHLVCGPSSDTSQRIRFPFFGPPRQKTKVGFEATEDLP